MKNTKDYLSKFKAVFLCLVFLLVQNTGVLSEEQSADHSELDDVQSYEIEETNQLNENTVSADGQSISEYTLETKSGII